MACVSVVGYCLLLIPCGWPRIQCPTRTCTRSKRRDACSSVFNVCTGTCADAQISMQILSNECSDHFGSHSSAAVSSISLLGVAFAEAADCRGTDVTVNTETDLAQTPDSVADGCKIGNGFASTYWRLSGRGFTTAGVAPTSRDGEVRGTIVNCRFSPSSRLEVFAPDDSLSATTTAPQSTSPFALSNEFSDLIAVTPPMHISVSNSVFTSATIVISGALPPRSSVIFTANEMAHSATSADASLPFKPFSESRKCVFFIGIHFFLLPFSEFVVQKNTISMNQGQESMLISFAGTIAIYEGARFAIVDNNLDSYSGGGRSQIMYGWAEAELKTPGVAPFISFVGFSRPMPQPPFGAVGVHPDAHTASPDLGRRPPSSSLEVSLFFLETLLCCGLTVHSTY